MNTHMWPVERRRPSGFQRLKDYRATISPRDLRTLLDPQEEDMPHRTKVRAALIPVQRTSLEQIDQVAMKVPFFDAKHMRVKCNEELAFACALDRPTPKDRLYAVLARAFARANRFADACADELDIKDQAPAMVRALDSALKALSSPEGVLWTKNRRGEELYNGSTGHGALMACERLALWREDGRKDRYYDLCQGIEIIERVKCTIEYFDKYGPQFGWPLGDEARFFFMLRLAEIFTISTGIVPGFSGERRKGAAGYWTDFARAALKLTGLETENFDALSRRLGGVGKQTPASQYEQKQKSEGKRKPVTYKNDFESSYGDRIRDMSKWVAELDIAGTSYNGEVIRSAGDLLSAGRAIDRKDSGEPLNWPEHKL